MEIASLVIGAIGFGFGVVAWIHARVTRDWAERKCEFLRTEIVRLEIIAMGKR